MPTHDTMSAALAAAQRGWHVFPLQPNTKRPALHGHDKCPRTGDCSAAHLGWEQRATTDPGRIRAAWSHGAYNVGVATGPSGLCVIDLDTLKPGEQVPEGLAADGVRSGEDMLAAVAIDAGEELPGDTLTVATPSGGLHLYYRSPAGVELRNTGGEQGRGLGWKIDTRAGGGYMVAPGSLIDGRVYELLHDGPVRELPAWLAQRLAPPPLPPAPVVPLRVAAGRRSRYLDAAIRAEALKVHQAPKGQRNAALYAAAVALGQLVAGAALSETEHREVLLTASGRHLATGAYSQHQARQTIRSGLRAGANRPRHIA